MRSALLLLPAAAAFGATAAGAVNDVVELQVPAQSVVDLVRQQAMQQAPCPEDLGGGLWLDHVEFPAHVDALDYAIDTDAGAAGNTARIELAPEESFVFVRRAGPVLGHKTRLVLPAVAAVKTEACVLDPNGCTTPLLRKSFDTVMDVYLDFPSDGSARMCTSFAGTSLPASLASLVDDQLAASLPTTCKKLDLDLHLDQLKVKRAGAAISTDGERVAIRIALAPSSTAGVGEFPSFLSGTLGPGASGHDGTTLFIAANLFTDFIDGKMNGIIAKGAPFVDPESAASSDFDPNAPSVATEAWADIGPCGTDLQLLADTNFSLTDIGGDHYLVTDVVSDLEYNETALGACAAWVGFMFGVPFFTDVAAATEEIAVQLAESTGVGSDPADPGSNGAFTGVGTNGVECEKDADCTGGGVCVENGDGVFICDDLRCQNGVVDGHETGVDCGGDSCEPCRPGDTCAVNDDCFSRSCAGGTCAAPTCSDGKRNGTEADVDCGDELGECPGCAVQKSCDADADCDSGHCDQWCDVDKCTKAVCAADSCFNGIRDGDEELQDCGGSQCAPCPDCFRVDDDHIQCFSRIDLPEMKIGSATAHPTIDTLETGEGTGLLLSGSFPHPFVHDPIPASVSIDDIKRRMGFDGDCNERGFFTDDGYVGSFDVEGSAGFHMCGAPAIVSGTDAFNAFAITDGSAGDALDQHFDVKLAPPPPDPMTMASYWDDPYDMVVHVESSGGAFTFTIPAPDVETSQAEIDAAKMKAASDKLTACTVLIDKPPYPAHFDPHWNVDPELFLELVDVGDYGGGIVLESAQLAITAAEAQVADAESVKDGAVVAASVTLDAHLTARLRDGGVFDGDVVGAFAADMVVAQSRDGLVTLTLRDATELRGRVLSDARGFAGGTAMVKVSSLALSNDEQVAR